MGGIGIKMLIIFIIFVLISQMQCVYSLQKIPDMDFVMETLQSGFYIAIINHPKSGSYLMEKEIWKPIEGFENIYEISNHGRVKSLDRYVGTGIKGNSKVLRKGKILKPSINCTGYLCVGLCDKSTNRKITALVHRLVAGRYVENSESKQIINHKDFNKQNNYFENLEWCTTQENVRYSVKHGRYPSGENNHNSKLSWEEVNQIREMRRNGLTLRKIGLIFNIADMTVLGIVKYKAWKK